MPDLLTKLAVTKVEVIERDPTDIESWKEPRLYFWLKTGERLNVLEMLQMRGSEPHEEVRGLLPEALKGAGLHAFDADEIRWSRKAGCSMCPCSPGFIMHGVTHEKHGEQFDVHLEVSVITAADVGEGI